MRKASLVPSSPNDDQTIYLVLDDFGPLGRAYRETDEAEADLDTVIENMLNGQYDKPVRVVCFNTAEGFSQDMSEDIALAVIEKAAQETTTLTDGVVAFVEKQTGREVEHALCA